MSNYNGRRAPNVSQYLANLNTVPTQQELSAEADLDLNNDRLDLFTSVDFFDFDAGSFAPTLDYTQAVPPVQDVSQDTGFQFNDFQAYPPSLTTSPRALPLSPSNGLQGVYPPQQPAQSQHTQQQQLQFPSQPPYPATSSKRKASLLQPPTSTPTQSADLEDPSSAAAEEDKRRRNTAASARFRVKKKQREAALEKTAKELTDKVTLLEGKVEQLELENKWLKGLITDKGGKALEGGERSSGGRKEGVGTEGVGTEGAGTEAGAASELVV